MNLSTGVNRDKELNAIMRRTKRPKIRQAKEECIFSCDDNYDDGYDYINNQQYNLEDEEDNCCIKDMMKPDSKTLMYIGLGIAVGAVGIYLLRR